MLEELLKLLVVSGWVYWLVACYLVHAFFRSRREGSPDRAAGGFEPPVSVLKPVCGLDPELYENLETFCRQEYPEYEIVIGVAEPQDPGVAVVERLQRAHPERVIRLVVADPIGANRKAAILHRLTAAARYDVLAMSDSDMRVTPEYLRTVVGPLADPNVGLVTCPYVAASAENLPAKLEALHMGVTFLPSVVVGRRAIGMRFALGASIVMRREDLEKFGGFAALANHLAEDYQLATQVVRGGMRIHLSDYIVGDVLGATSFREQVTREVRWARTVRVSRPREYPGLLLSFSTPLAVLLILVYGLTRANQQTLAVSLILRWVVGWLVTGQTADTVGRRALPWLPVRDLLSALVWLAGGFGRQVVWRGRRFVLLAHGTMKPVEEEAPLDLTVDPGRWSRR